jgi:hypothetical protein
VEAPDLVTGKIRALVAAHVHAHAEVEVEESA